MKYDFLNTVSYKSWRDKYLSDSNPIGDNSQDPRTDYSKNLTERKYNDVNNIFTIPTEAKTLSSKPVENGFNVSNFLQNGIDYSFDSKSFLQANGPDTSNISVQAPSNYTSSLGQTNYNAFDSLYQYQDVDQNMEVLSEVETSGKSAKGSGNAGNAIGSAVGFVGNQAQMWSRDDGDLNEGGHFMKNLQSGGEGAQAGASIGGGIGAIIGAVVGLGSGIIDSAIDNRKAQKRKKKEYFGNIDYMESERERMQRLEDQEKELKKLEALKRAQLGYLQNEHNYG